MIPNKQRPVQGSWKFKILPGRYTKRMIILLIIVIIVVTAAIGLAKRA